MVEVLHQTNEWKKALHTPGSKKDEDGFVKVKRNYKSDGEACGRSFNGKIS